MASINSLPAEVFLLILHFVGNGPELIPFVTVSRYWQLTIEQLSGSYKMLRIQNLELSKFASLFRPGQGHRKALVVTIHFTIILWTRRGNENQQFSDAILQLFRVLQAFNDVKGVNKCDGIRLGIGAAGHWGYVQLLNHKQLPALSCVSDFYRCNDGITSCIDPVSTILFASKLDGLKSCIVCGVIDSEIATMVKRKASRYAFATALSSYTGPLTKLYIDIKWRFPSNEATTPLDFTADASRKDPLNIALHELIQRRGLSEVSMVRDGGYIVSPEFFWPYGETQVGPTSTLWPNLEVLRMRCSPATPDGDWYFLADEKIASYDEFAYPTRKMLRSCHRVENTFRTVPNSKKMNPLLASIARAVRSAPAIRRLTLYFGPGPYGLTPAHLRKGIHLVRDFEVCYTAPGAKVREEESNDKPKLELRVKDWRPSEMVERLWRDALGPEGEIVYH